MNRWLKIAFSVLFVGAIIGLLLWISSNSHQRLVAKPEVRLIMSGDNAFITENELIRSLKLNGFIWEGQTWGQLQIDSIERFVSRISQVKSARVFTEVKGNWRIEVEMRNPVARIFNKYNESFYVDEEGVRMSISPSYTSRVLVVTGNIHDRRDGPSVHDIIKNDSLEKVHSLDEIFRISSYIQKDETIKQLIGQVYRKRDGDFVLVPILGNAKIIFGTATSDDQVEQKFEKLKVFYKEGLPNVGWAAYKEINLKYENQIVGKKSVNR